ncbi:uncharacterized protein LOC124115306 [Haliotis rufescens]|uniref:uncharacterized protein LOC124115306 n=1 Tax=Haliotis rufescens TaxID=6454 RepID=UPI00201ED767|nr:uncharacterized protein LOC124115306 [Haliotis rufescens]
MENHNSYQSYLEFVTTEADPPSLKLTIKWHDMSKVLVTVSDQLGQLKRLTLFERSKVNRLRCSGFSNSEQYTIEVFGLRQSTPTNQVRPSPATVYSVEAGKKVVISRVSGLQERVEVVDLGVSQYHFFSDRMIDMLKTQDLLLMEVKERSQLDNNYQKLPGPSDSEAGHRPPVDYILQPATYSSCTASLCVVFCEGSQKEYVVMSSTPVSTGIQLLPVCRSRTKYRVRAVGLKDYQVYRFDQPSPVCYLYECHESTKAFSIKTCMSKEELQQLKTMAVTYCRSKSRYPGKYTIKQFYRNKPVHYYTHIMSNRGGVMEKYIKDNNGDPYSAINKKINGLFFSGSLDARTRKPPDFSFFGDKRLFIPAEELFTWDTRMYFADFYCHNVVHYVTVVVTKKESAEDRFCEGRLIELDLKDNPFFTIKEEPSYIALDGTSYQDLGDTSYLYRKPFSMHDRLAQQTGLMSTEHFVSAMYQPPSRQVRQLASSLGECTASYSRSGGRVAKKTFTMVSVDEFHVEFLYTEDVDIRGLQSRCGEGKVYFEYVCTRGRGQSRTEGIPKKASCRTCNLERHPTFF